MIIICLFTVEIICCDNPHYSYFLRRNEINLVNPVQQIRGKTLVFLERSLTSVHGIKWLPLGRWKALISSQGFWKTRPLNSFTREVRLRFWRELDAVRRNSDLSSVYSFEATANEFCNEFCEVSPILSPDRSTRDRQTGVWSSHSGWKFSIGSGISGLYCSGCRISLRLKSTCRLG